MVPRVGEPGETSMSATNKTKQGGVLGFFRRLITPTAKLSSRMKRVAVSDEAPSDEGPSDERPEPSHGPVKKVLIIDDDPVILKTASMRLKAKGYEVATATEGAEALQLLRDGAPDLILLDINFPADIGGVPWDGFSLLRWLRTSGLGNIAPVMMITGDAAPYRKRAAAMGVAAIYSKPLDYEQLLAQMQRVLESRAKPDLSGPSFQT